MPGKRPPLRRRRFISLKTLAARAQLRSGPVHYIITSGTYKKLLSTVASIFRLSANSAVATKSQPPSGFYLSATHAAVGTNIGITGSGFGATQGTSTVTFGERPNRKGWASCARTATVVSWSNTYIVCTVPSMSPGKAGAPHTYHPVYLTIGGNLSPSLDFYINPVTTVTGQNYNTADLSSQHNVLYDGCSFTNSTYHGSAMKLAGGGYNLTFHNCSFYSSTWEGATINEQNNSNIRDITFSDCTFPSSECMDFECTARNCTTKQYERIALIGCTFEPAGAEAISFDGYVDWPTYCLVKDTLVKGAGNSSVNPWGYGLEINGPTHFTVQNVTIAACHFSNYNITGEGSNCNWVFENCVSDRTLMYPGQTAPSSSSFSIMCNTMNYSYWYNCSFKVSPATAGRQVWISNSSYNTWEACSWIGEPNSVYEEGSGSTDNIGLPE